MGIATTQAIWRSGGDDSTRTAYCGSMVMAATFYTANIAVSSNATVALGQTASVILPGNAVVTSVMITDPSAAGSINVGYVLVDGSANSANAFVDSLTATSAKTVTPGSTGAGTNMGLIMNTTKESVITIESSSAATGNVGGIIQYYVADYLFGQQNV
jgi:hypothetical protein